MKFLSVVLALALSPAFAFFYDENEEYLEEVTLTPQKLRLNDGEFAINGTRCPTKLDKRGRVRKDTKALQAFLRHYSLSYDAFELEDIMGKMKEDVAKAWRLSGTRLDDYINCLTDVAAVNLMQEAFGRVKVKLPSPFPHAKCDIYPFEKMYGGWENFNGTALYRLFMEAFDEDNALEIVQNLRKNAVSSDDKFLIPMCFVAVYNYLFWDELPVFTPYQKKVLECLGQECEANKDCDSETNFLTFPGEDYAYPGMLGYLDYYIDPSYVDSWGGGRTLDFDDEEVPINSAVVASNATLMDGWMDYLANNLADFNLHDEQSAAHNATKEILATCFRRVVAPEVGKVGATSASAKTNN